MGQAGTLEIQQVRNYLMTNVQTANLAMQWEVGLPVTEEVTHLYLSSRACKALQLCQLQIAVQAHEDDHRQSMRIEVPRMH